MPSRIPQDTASLWALLTSGPGHCVPGSLVLGRCCRLSIVQRYRLPQVSPKREVQAVNELCRSSGRHLN